MKRYTWKLGVAFIISYIILMIVVVFAYTQIANRFILKQANGQLVESGQIVSKQVELQLKYDYTKFEDVIISHLENTLDPIDELESNPESLLILGNSYHHFGLMDVTDRKITIKGEDYFFKDSFEDVDFNQGVAFYNFKRAFGMEDKDTMYGVFKVDEYLSLFELEPYITSFLTSEKIENEYVLMGEENTIYLSSSLNPNEILFYNYIRQSGYNENYINKIKETVVNHESSIFDLKFLNQKSILSFVPISTELATRTYYLVQIYDETLVLNSLVYLTSTLWALFAVIFVLFSVTLIVIYKILEQKNFDVEYARHSLYYAKPYIIKVRKTGVIRSYNRTFKQLLGDTRDQYHVINDFSIKDVSEDLSISEMLHRQKAFTILFEAKEKTVYLRFIITRSTGGYILIGDDITHIEGNFDAYQRLALYDQVTGLPNQNVLISDLDDIFLDQEKLEQHNVLVAFDIVSFAKINLVLGEENADRFLKLISEITESSLENYPAKLYNLKVDQFLVLFTNIESYQWIHTWVDSFLQQIDKPITIDKNFLDVDIKVGIFYIESQRYEILTSDICLDNAKLALNHAKESTVHRSFTYDVSLALVASREQKMENDLANAIINQEFKMALQAQYSNDKQRIIGFEALLRWDNPKYAAESPLKFIKMAEHNNMIVDIGRIALHETFLIAKELEPYDVEISLNISPVQMLQAGFVNEIVTAFEQYDLKPGSISLEITETFLIDSFELIINKLNILKRHGFNIHLDDFGTGYSSLQYLKDLPINTIKIDKVFIDDVLKDAHSRAIVTMISNLAKSIGLEVIAEGVENEKQNNMVYRSGCDIIQGYIIGPAVPKEKAIELLEAYNIKKTKTIQTVKLTKPTKSKEARR